MRPVPTRSPALLSAALLLLSGCATEGADADVDDAEQVDDAERDGTGRSGRSY